MNKMVNGKQLTIQFFIVNLHYSCVDGKVIDDLVHIWVKNSKQNSMN